MDATNQLDAPIDKRAKQGDSEREREAMYAASVRRYYERRRECSRQLWHSYHLDQAERFERTAAELAASHRAKADALDGSNLAGSKPEPP